MAPCLCYSPESSSTLPMFYHQKLFKSSSATAIKKKRIVRRVPQARCHHFWVSALCQAQQCLVHPSRDRCLWHQALFLALREGHWMKQVNLQASWAYLSLNGEGWWVLCHKLANYYFYFDHYSYFDRRELKFREVTCPRPAQSRALQIHLHQYLWEAEARCTVWASSGC